MQQAAPSRTPTLLDYDFQASLPQALAPRYALLTPSHAAGASVRNCDPHRSPSRIRDRDPPPPTQGQSTMAPGRKRGASRQQPTEVGEQKKKRIKSDTDSARFSAASMRNQLDQAASLKGEQVAARVKSDDEKDEWFVVKVIHFDKETKEYEVLDEEPGDDEESTQKYERKYKLPMSYIIPFPKKGDPSNAPDFGQGRQVLAVYPGTTALYRATVASHRKRKSDDYILEFDDDEEDGSLPQRAVPFYRVVALPEGHRQ